MNMKKKLFDSFPEGKEQLLKYLYNNKLGAVWYGNGGEPGFNNGSDKLSKTLVILIFKPEKVCECCGRRIKGDPMDKIMAIDGDFCDDWTNAPFPAEAAFLNTPSEDIGFYLGRQMFWWRFD